MKQILQHRLPALLLSAVAAVLWCPAAMAGLNISEPAKVKAVRATPNGDGNLVAYEQEGNKWTFRLYSPELALIKEFSLAASLTAGRPVGLTIQTGAYHEAEPEYRLLTTDIFNDDPLYEVCFSSGNIYNEEGKLIGTSDAGLIYRPSAEHNYIGGTSVAEEIDRAPMLVEIYKSQIAPWFDERMKLYYPNHSDFGLASINMDLEAMGQDMPSALSGYQWFTTGLEYQAASGNYYNTLIPYGFFYKMIYMCNDLLKESQADSGDSVEQTLRAEAFALRAWSYTYLAQLYQFTYWGHQDAPCVPIVDENNSGDLGTGGPGIPRNTVSEVYDYILADLDRAINLLSTTATAQEQIMPGIEKQMVSLPTAFGLRARVNLIMHRYAEAAADAKAAIDNFSGRPYIGSSEIQAAGMNNMDDPSWMWGFASRSGDDMNRGVVSFISMMSPFDINGYSSLVPRYINKKLFNSMSATDPRRRLFIDSNLSCGYMSELHLSAVQEMLDRGIDIKYMGLKFGCCRDVYDYKTRMGGDFDYPLMRVEEMYLIYTEAAMFDKLGNSTSLNEDARTAVDFFAGYLRTYRNISYDLTTPEAVMEAIEKEYRLEFWGEGIPYLTLQRLGKDVDRRGGGFDPMINYVVPADHPRRIKILPHTAAEVQNNAITDETNNPAGDTPVPVYEEG